MSTAKLKHGKLRSKPLKRTAGGQAATDIPVVVGRTGQVVRQPELPGASGAKQRKLAGAQVLVEEGFNWPVTIWILGVHVVSLAAPFYFSWGGLAIFAAFYFATACLGVTLGYHRLLTHGSFKTTRWLHYTLALLGQLSGEGSALYWVSTHRKHHQLSDKEGDPHSPRDGGFWAHILWLFPRRDPNFEKDVLLKYAPDLKADRGLVFLHKTFILWHFLLGVALLGIGWYGWNWETGVSYLLWGLFARMVFVFHVTWFVNSATHMWGYRNYETTDDSTNLWWVGLLAFGEGWHNNHHAFQRMAAHGHKWWEVDVTYRIICAFEAVGLAWNVVHEKPAHGIPA